MSSRNRDEKDDFVKEGIPVHDPAVHVELAIARVNSTPKAKGLNGLFADVAEMHAGALCNVTDDAQ